MKLKKILRKYWYWIVIIIIIAYFLYPKEAGDTCGFCPGPPAIQRIEYGCIGFKYEYQPPCLDCGRQILCYGIVTEEKKCYTYMNDFDNPPTEVPCYNECELHGGKCYGFGDLVAENCENHGMVTVSYNCPQITLNTQCCIRSSNCFWNPGNCLALVTPGYYYDSQAKECKYYQGSGCSSPPFNTMEECVSVCK